MINEYLYDVSIIFVNYKNTTLVVDAIKSLKEKSSGFKYEIIIVDNSNDINIINELKNKLDDNIIIIDAKENLGFGKGNNLGALKASGKYLFFLNTDTLLINNAIYELKNYLDNNKECGIAGPNLYTIDLKPNSSFYKHEWNIKTRKKTNSFFFFVKKHIFKKSIFFNYKDMPVESKGDTHGAALMIRHDLFDTIGGFDKDIFMYAEETLLCFNVRHKTNYKIYNVPSAKIIHLEGGSFKGQSEFQCKSFVDGNYIYFKKAFGEYYALKYLKSMVKVFKKKILLSKILRKKEAVDRYNNMVNAYKNKIIEVKKEIE